MVADQLVAQRGGRRASSSRGVGPLRYVVSPDHRHWHLLGFQRYALARPGGRVVVSDRKTGSASATATRWGRAGGAGALHSRAAGSASPRCCGMTQGISVGFGDAYAANLEGQYLRLNGLRAGRYVLVHRVNADAACARSASTTTPPPS